MKPYIMTSFITMSLLAGGLLMAPVNAQTVGANAAAKHRPEHPWMMRTATRQGQADLLGISLTDLQSRLSQGKTFQQIMTDLGLTRDQLKTRMREQQKTRIQKLVTDNKITQAQADKMLKRMSQPHMLPSNWHAGMPHGHMGKTKGHDAMGFRSHKLAETPNTTK